MTRFFAILLLLLTGHSLLAQVRIKDITEVGGARSNQLFGFGLVVGLDNTGGRNTFTQQAVVDMLQRMGVSTNIFSPNPADSVLRSNSVSAVMVVAEIGPFARKGSRIDVLASSIDDARSLQGGTLIMTPLRGADGQVYATAQGPLSVGGFSVGGAAAGVQKNQVNTGRVPNGAIVEKEAPAMVLNHGKAQLLLKEPDYNTARLIAKVINDRHPLSACAIDAGSVVVCPPPDQCATPTTFLAEIGLLDVQPDSPAKVVINERTGTVVTGEHVTISTTAVAHGNLFITSSENPLVSQPNAFSGGQTAVVPRTNVNATEEKRRLAVVPKSTTVAELARALNALGVSPRDLISIFQALKQAGALHAELVII